MVVGGSFMKPPVRYPEVQEDARSPKDAGLISRADLRQIRGTWRAIDQTCLFVITYSADRPSNAGLYFFHQALNRSIRRCNEILDAFVPEKPIHECHTSIMEAFKRCEDEANLSYPERDLTQFRPAFTSRAMEQRIREKIEQERIDAAEEDKFLPITT